MIANMSTTAIIALSVIAIAYVILAYYHYTLVREKLSFKYTIISSVSWLSWSKAYGLFWYYVSQSYMNVGTTEAVITAMLGFVAVVIPFSIAFLLIWFWHGYTAMLVFSPIFFAYWSWPLLGMYLTIMTFVKIVQTLNYITSDNDAERIFDDDYEMQWDGTYAKKDEAKGQTRAEELEEFESHYLDDEGKLRTLYPKPDSDDDDSEGKLY